MSVIQKKYKEKTRFYPKVYNPITKKYIGGGGYDTEAEAVKAEQIIKERLRAGRSFEKMTFKEILPKWYKYQQKLVETNQRSYSTFRGEAGIIKSFIYPTFSDIVINVITKHHVENFRDALGRRYEPATTCKILCTFSNIFNFSIDHLKIIEDNPCKDVKRPKVIDKPKTTWTPREVSYFFSLEEVKRESLYYVMFLLDFSTGMRPGEVCGLKESSLVEWDSSLTLEEGIDRYGGKTNLKTAKSHRAIRIDKDLFSLLEERLKWKHTQEKERNDFIHSDLLFTHPNGSPIKPDTLSRALKRLIKENNTRYDLNHDNRIKLPEITMYGARHSFATNTLTDGASVKVISDILGNSPEILLRKYAHLSRSLQSDEVQTYTNKIYHSKKENKRKEQDSE